MSEPDAVNLKTLLSSAKALLKPPQPLPSSPPALLERLRSSSELLPSWRSKPGWGEDDELDEIGDDDDSDKDKRKARRDALVQLVGKRSLDIVVGMQEWLEKEFWPLEARGGLDAKECELTTVRIKLTSSPSWHGGPQAVAPAARPRRGELPPFPDYRVHCWTAFACTDEPRLP